MMGPEDQTLLDRLPPNRRADNGVPTPERAARQERLIALAEAVLGDTIAGDGVRISPLGAGWSRDVDVHVVVQPMRERMLAHGWIPLSGFWGQRGDSSGTWAVTEGWEVLGLLDIHAHPVVPPVNAVLNRCMARGEARLREVLELRCLMRAGNTLPMRHPALSAAAAAESALGGNMLAPWRPAPNRILPPVGIRRVRCLQIVKQAVPRRRRQFVVAVSGIDGAGKTRLITDLAGMAERLGIGVTTVWSRPGMGLGVIDRFTRAAKRRLRGDARATMRVAEGSARPVTRRGLFGWLWAMVVTGAFIVDLRRQHRAPGVLKLYDRHLLDALTTLNFLYEGVSLSAHRALIRRLVPRASLTVWLDISPGEAARRKPDAVFNEAAAAHQSPGYKTYAHLAQGLHRIDAVRDPADISLEVFKAICKG